MSNRLETLEQYYYTRTEIDKINKQVDAQTKKMRKLGMDEDEVAFRVNGNPVSHLLSIDAGQVMDHVVISDITGKIVRDEMIQTRHLRMEVGDLREGVYFVRLRSGAEEHVLKILKK